MSGWFIANTLIVALPIAVSPTAKGPCQERFDPAINARVEEAGRLSCQRVDSGYVRSLVTVTASTSQGEVVEGVVTAVL